MNQVFIKVPIKWCIKVLIYDNVNNLCILLQFFLILHNKMLDHINPFKKSCLILLTCKVFNSLARHLLKTQDCRLTCGSWSF